MLVLRALPVVEEVATAEQRVQEEVALACALLDRGVYHGDLHTDNFVRLASGALAVLDMQSARRFSPSAAVARRTKLSVCRSPW